MGIKILWLATWTLLWVGMAGCTQDSSLKNAYPTAAASKPTQPAGIVTPLPLQASAAITYLPVEDSSVELTPSPETSEPGLKEQLAQIQKETVESAIKDLAQRLGIRIEEISVLSVIGQDFTTNGFFCRSTKGRTSKDEPTVMISGETILLKAHGRRYEYHANSQVVIFCRKLK